MPVPRDAYSLDFVFSDAAEGGSYDNRGGLDYHLPVEGGVVAEPPLYVCHVAVEMAPICKVWGVGAGEWGRGEGVTCRPQQPARPPPQRQRHPTTHIPTQVGGLGDVVTALGRAVQEAGHRCEVILPRYDFFSHSPLLGATQVGRPGPARAPCRPGGCAAAAVQQGCCHASHCPRLTPSVRDRV